MSAEYKVIGLGSFSDLIHQETGNYLLCDDCDVISKEREPCKVLKVCRDGSVTQIPHILEEMGSRCASHRAL